MTDFIIVSNKNAMAWKEIFPLFMKGWVKFGYENPNYMLLPSGTKNNMQGITKWFTSFSVDRKNKVTPIKTDKVYDVFDTYGAINIDSIYEIPEGYEGEMGCPLDIMRYLPEGYEITGKLKTGKEEYDYAKPIVNGKYKYVRILIRKNRYGK